MGGMGAENKFKPAHAARRGNVEWVRKVRR